jgi:hypothetical protein
VRKWSYIDNYNANDRITDALFHHDGKPLGYPDEVTHEDYKNNQLGLGGGRLNPTNLPRSQVSGRSADEEEELPHDVSSESSSPRPRPPPSPSPAARVEPRPPPEPEPPRPRSEPSAAAVAMAVEAAVERVAGRARGRGRGRPRGAVRPRAGPSRTQPRRSGTLSQNRRAPSASSRARGRGRGRR